MQLARHSVPGATRDQRPHTASALAETNYCYDPAATASWERIKGKHCGERDIEAPSASGALQTEQRHVIDMTQCI